MKYAKCATVILLFLSLVTVTAAETECEVMESVEADVHLDGEVVSAEEGMQISPQTVVETSQTGGLVAMCDDTEVHHVSGSIEGELEQVSITEAEAEEAYREQVDFEEVLDAEEMDENLEELNQVMKEEVPGPIRTVILGDDVNLAIGNSTVGIKSNNSEIVGVEDEELEDPTLEIRVEEDAMFDLLAADDMVEEFRQAYHGEGIEVEANTWKNKAAVGTVTMASRAYGFVSDIV